MLITSNESYVLEVEPSDRRYTIFNTAGNIAKKDFLGYGSYEKFASQIERELEDFALLLKGYPVDVKLANTALDTPEKMALIEATTDKYTLFAKAIINKDLLFFEDLRNGNFNLFKELKEDFLNNRINQALIPKIYNAIFDENIASKTLMRRLRNIEPVKFDTSNIRKSDGIKYFSL